MDRIDQAKDAEVMAAKATDLDDLLGIVQMLSTQNGDPPLPEGKSWDEQRGRAWDEEVKRFSEHARAYNRTGRPSCNDWRAAMAIARAARASAPPTSGGLPSRTQATKSINSCK